MKIDMTQQLINFKGETIPTSDKDATPLTLGDVAITALMSVHQGEQPDGKKSFWRYQIASKVSDSKDCKLEAEEVTEIKERIGKHYTPVVVGPAYELIEGKDK